jgi:hypothetical protein
MYMVIQINSWDKYGARRSVEDRRLCEAKALGSNPSESICVCDVMRMRMHLTTPVVVQGSTDGSMSAAR